MEHSLDVDIDFDDNMNGTLIITCPQCQNKMRRKLKSLNSGAEITCNCGTNVIMSDNEFMSVQKSIDDLKRSISCLGS